MEIDKESIVPISTYDDTKLAEFMKKNAITLKVSEARTIAEKLGRDPTLTEFHIFNIEWSEHCSYKSSKNMLKKLPTTGSKVIQGPKEDAGIVFFTEHKGDRYGIAIGHESHNHPSQLVPFEGAATGIGGIVRDVNCMGARVFACADPLRFGDPYGKNKNRTKYIAEAVVDGIAGYGNPLGIPNIGGDAYFSDSFDDNCLVNVACLGVVKEKEIIHSAAPKNAIGYDVILIGKPTDNSGFGGASFASVILTEEDKEANKGAVQVPDPFLKNILLRATENVFQVAREKGIVIGFKDCGAGGVMCASSELGEAGGVGIEVDLDKVHISMDIPSYIIACGETQERYVFISPKDFTPTILKIMNEDWALPKIAKGAQASVIGKVRDDMQFVMTYQGKVVCNAPIKEVTTGIVYDRERKKAERNFEEPELEEPSDYNHILLDVLSHPNVASKARFFKHYDTMVQGNTIIGSGQADAGVMAPIPDCKAAVALSVDCNPNYTKIDPKLGSMNAVAEAMRNVAAVGATPYAMTDCLCFGNPEIPENFNDFCECVEGISEAASKLCLKGSQEPVPFVSGNVSFYNESSTGKQVDPSPIIACLGVMQDCTKAITMQIKKPESVLLLIGERRDELGGSVYYKINGHDGKNVPQMNFAQEKGMIHGVIDAIDKGLLLACHDVSDGGVITTVSEMILGGEAAGKIGATLQFNDGLAASRILFSESSGFVMEVPFEKVKEVEDIFEEYHVDVFQIGSTGGSLLAVNYNDQEVINLTIEQIKDAWWNGIPEALE